MRPLEAFGAAAAAFVAAAVADAVAGRWARTRGLLDPVEARRSHTTPTPRLGGIGVVVGLAVGWGLAWSFAHETVSDSRSRFAEIGVCPNVVAQNGVLSGNSIEASCGSMIITKEPAEPHPAMDGTVRTRWGKPVRRRHPDAGSSPRDARVVIPVR